MDQRCRWEWGWHESRCIFISSDWLGSTWFPFLVWDVTLFTVSTGQQSKACGTKAHKGASHEVTTVHSETPENEEEATAVYTKKVHKGASHEVTTVHSETPENEEEATVVYAKKVHKGASDEVNRVFLNEWSEGDAEADLYIKPPVTFVTDICGLKTAAAAGKEIGHVTDHTVSSTTGDMLC